MTYVFLISALAIYVWSWSAEARALRLMSEGAYQGFIDLARRESIRYRLLAIFLMALAIWTKI